MGWQSDRVTMSGRRLLSLMLGGAIVLSLVAHSTIAIGYAVLTRDVPSQLLFAMVLLALALAILQMLRGLALA